MDVTAILSGIKLDLSDATIKEDRATINVNVIMGGIEIIAPKEWNIISEVTPILGAYIDKRRPSTTPATHTLLINGVVSFRPECRNHAPPRLAGTRNPTKKQTSST